MSEGLFPAPARVIGECEARLALTLTAWDAEGFMVGGQYAAARGILIDAARAVDLARSDVYGGEGSAYSFARTNELFRQALDAARPREEAPSHDGIDDLIANISGPPVRD